MKSNRAGGKPMGVVQGTCVDSWGKRARLGLYVIFDRFSVSIPGGGFVSCWVGIPLRTGLGSGLGVSG